MNLKRIAALIGAVLLLGLFAAAIILAVTGAPANYLLAVIFSIVFFSALLYAMGLMIRVLKKPEENSSGQDTEGKKP